MGSNLSRVEASGKPGAVQSAGGASPDHALAAAPEAVAAVGSEVWVELAARLGVAVLAFALALLIGRRLLVGIVGHVHRTGSRELFMLAMLLIVIGAAWGAHEVGLSPPLGAFLAGMILGETELKHDAEEDIRPFRDVLLGLFFVSVGLRVDGGAIVEAWAVVLGLLLALVLVKGPIVYALARLFGEPHAVAARAAVILAHGGELTLALGAGVVPAAIGQPLLGAIVLSMIAAPFLIGANGRIASRLSAGTERAPAGGAVGAGQAALSAAPHAQERPPRTLRRSAGEEWRRSSATVTRGATATARREVVLLPPDPRRRGARPPSRRERRS